MIDPKPLDVTTQGGEVKTFLLTKLPATVGREVVAKYPVANVPKLGDYKVSEEVMLTLMSHVYVETPGGPLALRTKALVDNHCGDWETLARLEMAMLEYNVSFFGRGLNSSSLESLIAKARPWISQILTALSAQSSLTEKPPSTN